MELEAEDLDNSSLSKFAGGEGGLAPAQDPQALKTEIG